MGNSVDVRRFITHHALVVGAEVPVSDVISPKDEDVSFSTLGKCRKRKGEQERKADRRETVENRAILFILASRLNFRWHNELHSDGES